MSDLLKKMIQLGGMLIEGTFVVPILLICVFAYQPVLGGRNCSPAAAPQEHLLLHRQSTRCYAPTEAPAAVEKEKLPRQKLHYSGCGGRW